MHNGYTTVEYDGYVVNVTSTGIWFAKTKDAEEPELTMPRRFVGSIEYENGGDTMFRKFGKIRSFECAGWLAQKEGLV